MNKKAYTLIELLAVIIIISLISVIIVPKVQNTIKESRKNTYKASAHALAREANSFFLETKSNLTPFTGCTYNFTNSTNTCEGFEFTGKKPEKGKLKISNDGTFNFAIKLGDYCYIKYQTQDDIKVIQYNEDTCNSASFESDSWEEIKANLTANRNIYPIGSEKEVIIDNISYTVRLANTSSCPNDWPQAASQTTCGVVIEFIDAIKDSENNNVNGHIMNPSSENYTNGTNIGGWPASTMKNYLNETIFNKLPAELKTNGMILDTKTLSSHGATSGETNFTSIDKLYLLSYVEIWGKNFECDTVKLVNDTVTDGTKRLEYYSMSNPTKIKKTIEGIDTYWWLRSASQTDTYNFLAVNDFGDISMSPAKVLANSVTPAFRILD